MFWLLIIIIQLVNVQSSWIIRRIISGSLVLLELTHCRIQFMFKQNLVEHILKWVRINLFVVWFNNVINGYDLGSNGGISRSSHPEVKNFPKFTGKSLYWGLFLRKFQALRPAILSKSDSSKDVFLWKKLFKNTYFLEYFQTAASEWIK